MMSEMFLLGMPGGSEMIILLVVVLLLFGGTRLPQLAKGLGQSIKEFKKGVAHGGEDTEEVEGSSARRPSSLRAAKSAGFKAEEVTRDGYIVTEGRS